MQSWRRRGFTLVETLVAITILMIAIAGPLVIATKGLTSATYSKDQMIASFLAQESMEVIKNVHDNNVYPYKSDEVQLLVHWLDGLGTIGQKYDAAGIGSPQIQGCTITASSPGCAIYYSDVTGYTPNLTSIQTPFYRHYYLESLSNTEVRVHVLVDWREGSIPFQVHLISNMTASSR